MMEREGAAEQLRERTFIFGLRYESIFIVLSGIVVSGDSYHDNAVKLVVV